LIFIASATGNCPFVAFSRPIRRVLHIVASLRFLIDDLNSVGAHRRELNRVYGEMRTRQLLSEIGTKLAYVLCQGAGLARIEQDLLEASLIRDELIRQGKLTGQISHHDLPLPEAPAADAAPIEITP
jgi:hypothetical protein